ncbi:MAG TPA: c-type cytochrome [Acidiferrobacteraceae bacterium]|nr:c-type cytochrome [Acidiferrobacteraceae bacterium]
MASNRDKAKNINHCHAIILALSLIAWGHPAWSQSDAKYSAQIYKKNCAACHDTGNAGAPPLSDAGNWDNRLSWPRWVTNRRVINGYGTMPPRGGNNALSDQDVKDAVTYMIARIEAGPQKEAENPKKTSRRNKNKATPNNGKYHKPPQNRETPKDSYGDEVRLGKKIFTQTYKYARRYVGNEMSCANCHLDAGRKPNAAPMWAAYGMYPAYRRKNDRTNTLQERIQQCFRFSLNGISPALDAPELRALTSYMHFISKGVPVGVNMPGRGYPQIKKTGFDPNPARGETVYKTRCTSCHGSNGKGKNRPGGGYIYPPLWGGDSYNKAADMYQIKHLAGFIKTNMPKDQEGSLSDQQALDAAAYINTQLRPGDPRKGLIQSLFD